MKQTKNLGFTIIELLMVISIIALLSSIVLVSFNLVRVQARDVRRSQDVDKITQALELYFADNGKYPELTQGANYPLYSEGQDSSDYTWPQLEAALSPYMTNLPVSNLPGSSGMYYKYYTGGTSDICISGYGGNGTTAHVIVEAAQQGFALLATMESNEVLTYNDGGPMVNLFDRYGGSYTVTSC